jgi:hypothetical protein
MPEISPSKYLVNAGWDDVPHLTEQMKRELLESTPPHLRDARSKGIPSLGSGAIFPVEESTFVIEPFDLLPWWPRAYGMDVGWDRTAAIWGALDRESDILFLYSEHYMGKTVPAIHASAIRGRGTWIPGVIDPASRSRGQRDGENLLRDYKRERLRLAPADNAVESGLFTMWQRLTTGRLKVFSTCTNFLAEYRMYRRDENGKVIKEFNHLMDATRYLVVSGLRRARVENEFARDANLQDEILETF